MTGHDLPSKIAKKVKKQTINGIIKIGTQRVHVSTARFPLVDLSFGSGKVFVTKYDLLKIHRSQLGKDGGDRREEMGRVNKNKIHIITNEALDQSEVCFLVMRLNKLTNFL